MCNHPKKANHTMCRKCFLGAEAYSKEKERLNKVRRRRYSRRIGNPKYFKCEMGYGDCELRGYCNGDC